MASLHSSKFLHFLHLDDYKVLITPAYLSALHLHTMRMLSRHSTRKEKSATLKSHLEFHSSLFGRQASHQELPTCK